MGLSGDRVRSQIWCNVCSSGATSPFLNRLKIRFKACQEQAEECWAGCCGATFLQLNLAHLLTICRITQVSHTCPPEQREARQERRGRTSFCRRAWVWLTATRKTSRRARKQEAAEQSTTTSNKLWRKRLRAARIQFYLNKREIWIKWPERTKSKEAPPADPGNNSKVQQSLKASVFIQMVARL